MPKLQVNRQTRIYIWKTPRTRKALHIMYNSFYYVVVLSLCFVFIYPLLFMLSQAMMQPEDLMDATVVWLPKTFSFFNYAVAFDEVDFFVGLKNSLINSLGGGILQVLGCSFAAYGFARYRFPGSNIWFVLLLCTFLIPPQTLIVPLYLFFTDLGWTQSALPILVPSIFGHGWRGALFVLVFIQFFKGMPQQLEESAKIDGAGVLKTFFVIILPLARPAIIVVFLFSFVWHWNELFEPNLYLTMGSKQILSQKLTYLKNLQEDIVTVVGSGTLGGAPTQGPRLMAASLITILPLLLIYLFAQRYFVESIERTGITGE